ncbi:isochorismate synthase [Stigmatella aurantiaca]|uniref:isochorismate synthase n=1 Tax=Stigmatella aurantiaca (strain DW4/3-1) TaxID=378806 RepID=Q08ML2_STIAD|nr:isochorismate synthase [Stigmatella aurantiaca]ADO72136.1 Isochorismate synthase [Stigmatella aurantiaca DW4/3-1]EAU61719.1 salicylate biosynthesis isochorismate synthase [Stigmatella aurantiaca DW4/3-1]
MARVGTAVAGASPGTSSSLSIDAPALAGQERWVGGMLYLAAVDPLAGVDVLGEPSLYWDSPQMREVVAGWGEAGAMVAGSAQEAREVLRLLSSAATVRWAGEVPASLPGPWFGGMRFAAEGKDEGWGPFGFGRWTLPERMVWREGDRLAAAAFVPEGPGAEEQVRALLVGLGANFPAGPLPSRRTAQALRVSSSRLDFERSVERATETIAQGRLQKVVLARAVEIEGERPFAPVDVLARLREQNPRCTTFLFRASDGTAFLGATPETLCRWEGRELRTEALAGTAPVAQAQELSGRDKERREHHAVVRYLLEVLGPLAERIDADEVPTLLTLKNMVHLRTSVRAQLREGVGVADLVAAMHPTPAVGGTPSAMALAFLLEHEGLDRGWYAAPVGWVGPGRAHQVVALRSARVKGSKARLFVGAGIVAGSNAQAEWRETELKSLTMVRALGGTEG